MKADDLTGDDRGPAAFRAAIFTALLMAPVAWHLLVLGRHHKEILVKGACLMTLGGLAAAGRNTWAAVLVVSYVAQG